MLRNELYEPWFAGESDWGISIIDGEYSGVTIQIEKLEFSDNNSSSVDLNFHVVNQPEHIEIDTSSETFNQVMQIIISDILQEAVKIYEQDRIDGSTESSK